MGSITQDHREQILKNILDVLTQGLNGRQCVGYQKLTLSTSSVSRLTVPAEAMSAEITVEPDSASTNANLAIRYTVDNATNPETGTGNKEGVPLGDYDTLEVVNRTNLTAFRAIAADAASTKRLKILYYRS